MKRTLLIFLFLAITSMANAQSNDRLLIRIYEGNADHTSEIIVTKQGEVIETVDLSSLYKGKNYKPNQESIDRTLNKYLDSDYKIVSSTSGGSQTVIITTYILEKE